MNMEKTMEKSFSGEWTWQWRGGEGPIWLVDSEIGSSQLGSSTKEIHPNRLITVSIEHLIRVIKLHIFRVLENTRTYCLKCYTILHYCFI